MRLWASYEKKITFCVLKINEERSRILIRTKMSRIANTARQVEIIGTYSPVPSPRRTI
jgi:hypothetical protein